MKLYEALTYYRKLKKITFDELVVKTGISKSTLQKVFTGVTANPAFDTVQTIAVAMEISVNDIAAATRGTNPAMLISPAAMSIARKYEQLDDHGRQVVDLVADLELKRVSASYADETDRFNGMAARPSTESTAL